MPVSFLDKLQEFPACPEIVRKYQIMFHPLAYQISSILHWGNWALWSDFLAILLTHFQCVKQFRAYCIRNKQRRYRAAALAHTFWVCSKKEQVGAATAYGETEEDHNWWSFLVLLQFTCFSIPWNLSGGQLHSHSHFWYRLTTKPGDFSWGRSLRKIG